MSDLPLCSITHVQTYSGSLTAQFFFFSSTSGNAHKAERALTFFLLQNLI